MTPTEQTTATAPITVTASATNAGLVAEIVASLPVSLVATSDGTATVVEIDGRASWTSAAEAAIANGARGIVVTDPDVANLTEVHALAQHIEQSGVVLALSERFAGNPAVDAVRPTTATTIRDARVVSVHITAQPDDPADRSLLAAVRVLRGLGAGTPSFTVVTADSRSLTAVGHVGTTPVIVTAAGTRALAPAVDVRAVAATTGLEARLPDATSARPAEVLTIDDRGATAQPTLWETAHRTAWRALVAAIDDPDAPDAAAAALRAFAADIRAVQR